MKTYRIEKRIPSNGALHLDTLPFVAGELVEVISMSRNNMPEERPPSKLRGKVLAYIEPTEPVAETDWSVLH
jgi:hypothetical protein